MNPRTVPYRPSNGSEDEAFQASWCERCQRDAAFRADPDAGMGCPILANTLAFDLDDPEYPPEWIEDDVPHDQPSNPRCTAFEQADDDWPIMDARQSALL